MLSEIKAPESILVVDDSASNRLLLDRVLTRAGYLVTTVKSGTEALSSFAATPFDVVLLDVLMPAMDGFEVCRRLRATSAGRLVPIVFLTALDDAATHQSALESGADDLLHKPINATELLMRVRSLLWVVRLRKEAESGYELIRTQRNQLLQVQRAKQHLTNLVVHDLKTPLTTIISNAHYLAEKEPDGDTRECALDIQHAAASMLRLVRNILDISLSEDGSLSVQPVWMDLPQLVEAVLASMRRRADERQMRLVARVSGAPAEILADAELLRRLCENLVDNCLKYATPGTRVEVEASLAAGGKVHLAVRDEGPGIPPEMRSLIFEPYARLERDDAQAPHSQGLGLAFCKLAAELHGGRIWVEPNEPRGSCFRVELPVPVRVAKAPAES